MDKHYIDALIPDETVTNKIYKIRGQKVMLDFDLAILYEVETRVLKQAVKRNIIRFPEDFMFRLSKKEWLELITNCDNLAERVKFSPFTPFAFTEQGVAMLSSILNSERAIYVNIQVIRIFTRIRTQLKDVGEIRLEIEKIKGKLTEYDENMGIIFQYLDGLIEKQEKSNPGRTRIGFKPDHL